MTIQNPEIELTPHQIIDQNKKREEKFNILKSALLDIFLVFYSLIVLERAIYYKFILELRELPFSWREIGIIYVISVVLGISMDILKNFTFMQAFWNCKR